MLHCGSRLWRALKFESVKVLGVQSAAAIAKKINPAQSNFAKKNYKSKVAFEQTSSLLNLKISGVPQQPQREEEVDENKQAEE